MGYRTKMVVISLAIISLTLASPSFSQDKFKLKPGAGGKLCLVCHVAFKEKMQLPFIHTPVRKGDCSVCHNPHTSSHAKLIAADANKICLTCHDEIVAGKAKSTHKVAADGNCVKCHDPHASKIRFNLIVAGNELCGTCHKAVVDAIKSNKFKHVPVEQGCTTCHNPHASRQAQFLLKKEMPAICTGCHSTKLPVFAKSHMNYPVEKSNCISCHDPHGSNKAGIMWDGVHPPVAKKMCNQCHPDASSRDALKAKRAGLGLCRGCHNDAVNNMLARNRVHGPVLDEVACLNCHTPHASRQGGLLKAPMKNLCGTCHEDTIERQAKSFTKHKPIEEGKCTACHLPHSANSVFLMDNVSTINLCGKCHEWQKHSTHPIGEKVNDPRNKNLSLDCESCHRTHGSEHKYFMNYESKKDICIQCHTKYMR